MMMLTAIIVVVIATVTIELVFKWIDDWTIWEDNDND